MTTFTLRRAQASLPHVLVSGIGRRDGQRLSQAPPAKARPFDHLPDPGPRNPHRVQQKNGRLEQAGQSNREVGGSRHLTLRIAHLSPRVFPRLNFPENMCHCCITRGSCRPWTPGSTEIRNTGISPKACRYRRPVRCGAPFNPGICPAERRPLIIRHHPFPTHRGQAIASTWGLSRRWFPSPVTRRFFNDFRCIAIPGRVHLTPVQVAISTPPTHCKKRAEICRAASSSKRPAGRTT